MKKLSEINEGLWSASIKRNNTDLVRKEDIRQPSENWWEDIKLPNPTKYPAGELKSWEIGIDLIHRVEKTLGIKNQVNGLLIFFKDEQWQLHVTLNTSYGRRSITLSASCIGKRPYNVLFSEMNANEKRSVKHRLDNKIFYIYETGSEFEYLLSENPQWKNTKGTLLQK